MLPTNPARRTRRWSITGTALALHWLDKSGTARDTPVLPEDVPCPIHTALPKPPCG